MRHARDKAIVERVFHSFKTFLLEKLPGATFAPKLMREFGYDPEKDACLTVSELRELIEHFIAVYHVTVHSGIGMQPALFWSKSLATHGRQLLANSRQFGLLTGETRYGVRADREGLIIDGIRYVSAQSLPVLLDTMVGAQAARTMDHFEGPPAEVVDGADEDGADVPAKPGKAKRRKARAAGLGNNSAWATVKVKINSANLLHIHAFVPGHGWLEFEAANRDYFDGLSSYQHDRIKEWAKARNMAFSTEEDQLAARHAIAEHIRELAPDMDTRERRAMARMTREGDVATESASHMFADEADAGFEDGLEGKEVDGVIRSEPCDDRSDAEVAPQASKRSRGGKGATGRKGRNSGASGGDKEVDAQGEDAAKLLKELLAVDWDMPIDEDEVMEEYA